MEKFCPKCGTKAPDVQSAFCNRCGTRLPEPQPEIKGKICPNCSTEIIDKNSVFCPRCGNPISAPVLKNIINPDLGTKTCPSCGDKIDGNRIYCPSCGAYLKGSNSNDVPLPKVNLNQVRPDKIQYSEKSTYRENIEEKSPLLALICSFFIPGLGQVYNGKTARGIGIFLGSLIGLILIIPGLIVWIYGMYDAYSMSKKMNTGQIQFLPTKTAHVILFVLLAIIVGIIGIVFIAEVYSGFQSSSTNSQFSGLSPGQIRSQAQNISYSNLMHSPEGYKNTIVYYRGQILEVQNIYGDQYMLRIATKEQAFLGYTDDIIYVDYNGERPVEGDIVDLWGNFVGLKTYTAVLGNQITIPEVNKLYMTIYQEKT